MEFLTIISTIGGICGALVTIMGFLTLLLKKPKEWIKKIALDTHNEHMDETIELLKKINSNLEEQKKTDLALLRHEITSLYFKYKENKEIPSCAKQDWISMYERYLLLGGNSYIKTITDIMTHEWKESSKEI